MSSLFVLRHGRREKINISPGAPLQTSFESYCKAAGLDAQRYALQYNGKRIDLSLPSRFLSVPPNALVDLVEKTAAERSAVGGAEDVRVALQLPSGGRVQGNFSASATLGSVVEHFADQGLLPGCPRGAQLRESSFDRCHVVYMRNVIAGGNLASTTLSSMGLSRGAASMQVAYPAEGGLASPARSPSAEAASAVAAAAGSSASSPLSQAVNGSPMGSAFDGFQRNGAAAPSQLPPAAAAAAETVAAVPAPVDIDSMDEDTGSPAGPPVTTLPSEPEKKEHKQSSSAAGAASKPAQAAPIVAAASAAVGVSAAPAAIPAATAVPAAAATTGVTAMKQPLSATAATSAATRALSLLRAEVWDSDALEAVTTILKILDNVIGRPGDARTRTLRLGNPRFHSTVGCRPGGIQILESAGFTRSDSSSNASESEATLTLLPENEDDRALLAVREAVADEAATLGMQNVPAAPLIDAGERARAAAAAREAAASFDPFKPSLTRVAAAGSSSSNGAGGGVSVVSRTLGGGGPSSSASSSTSSSSFGGAGHRLGSGGSSPATTAASSATYSRNSAPTGSSSSHHPSSSSSSTSPTASLAVAAGGSVGEDIVVREPPHLTPSELSRLTDTERRVAALRQKAVAMQCVRAPSKRSTRIVLFDPQLENHSNQNTFSEAEANGGAISIGSSGADDDEDMDNDPQVMRMRMEQLQRKIAESNEEKGLKTRAQRELEALKSAKVFTSALIRIQMLDRSTVQATFSPLEPVSAIYDWVRGLLSSELSGAPFFLYTTPPPCPLPSSSATLQEAKLLPAILLYFGWGTASVTGSGGGSFQRLPVGVPGGMPLESTLVLSAAAMQSFVAGPSSSSTVARGAGAAMAAADAAAFPTGVSLREDSAAAAAAADAPSTMVIAGRDGAMTEIDVDALAASLLGGGSGGGGGVGRGRPGGGGRTGTGGDTNSKPAWMKLK